MLDFTKELCPDRPLIHPTSQTKNCRFGRYVEIGDHCVLEETEVGDYTYCFGSNDIIYTALGKFNSIATGVRINPVQHPAKLRAAAHHFTYRCSHYGLGPDDAALIDWRRQNHRVVTWKRRVAGPQRGAHGRRHPGRRRGGGRGGRGDP